MFDSAPATAVRYTSDLEASPSDEAESIAGIDRTLLSIQEITAESYGHGVRALHAKGHAVLKGTLEVFADLPPLFAQGLFSTPAIYDAIVRISTNPGDILDDGISVPRGFALKIVGAGGERLEGGAAEGPQDFVLVNAPAFAASNPKAFLPKLRLLAATTDRGEDLKKAFSQTLQVVESALEAVGSGNAGLRAIGGARQSHPLGDIYYSQTPFLYGEHIAKFSVAPASLALLSVAGEKVETRGKPDALRETIDEVVAEHGGEWEFRVQLCTDPERMPIEDAGTEWSENESPFITVAKLVVPPQSAWAHVDDDRNENVLSFSPWHGLAAHCPLGGINRARRTTYERSATFRATRNGCPMREPHSVSDRVP